MASKEFKIKVFLSEKAVVAKCFYPYSAFCQLLFPGAEVVEWSVCCLQQLPVFNGKCQHSIAAGGN